MIQVRVQYQADIIIFKLMTAQYHLIVNAFVCRTMAKAFYLLMRLFTVQTNSLIQSMIQKFYKLIYS